MFFYTISNYITQLCYYVKSTSLTDGNRLSVSIFQKPNFSLQTPQFSGLVSVFVRGPDPCDVLAYDYRSLFFGVMHLRVSQ